MIRLSRSSGRRMIRTSLHAAMDELFGREFALNVIGTIGTRIVLVAIGVTTSVLVARSLGPTGRGEYAVAIAVAAIGVQLTNLGLHASNTWAVARQPSLLGNLVANSLVVSAAGGTAFGIFAILVLQAMPTLIALPPILVTLALASVPLGLCYLMLQHLLVGTNQVRTFNAVELFVRSAVVALLGAAIFTHGISAIVCVAVGLSASAFGAVACAVSLWRYSHHPFRPNFAVLRVNARFGLKAYASALFSFLVLRLDILLVQHYRGSAEAGYYSISVSMADLLYMLPVVIGMLLFPRLTALRNEQMKWRIASRTAIVVLAIMMIASAISIPFANPAVDILYGSQYTPAASAFVWLLPGTIALSISTVLMNYAGSIGMPSITWVAPLAGLCVNVTLNSALIPTYGIVGAAASSSIAYVLVTALLIAGLGTSSIRVVPIDGS